MTCWLDSQAALGWIYGENKQFKRFVQSPVERIRKLVNKERFRYVPSELNPSDIGSRGTKLSETRNNPFHWNGPDFLLQSEERWPDILRCPSDAAVAVEVKSELKLPPVESLTVLYDTSGDPQGIQTVINCEDYSSLDKLLRVTARVLQFIENSKRRHCACF